MSPFGVANDRMTDDGTGKAYNFSVAETAGCYCIISVVHSIHFASRNMITSALLYQQQAYSQKKIPGGGYQCR